jgi:wyosine [tRNA(Phe)-imidazoG37] synthetase (radical SAM superfamily)
MARAAPFDCPRKTLGARYVYAVMSPRARGLSIGVNLNPGKRCNFDCIYCEVDRTGSRVGDEPVDVRLLANELEQTLGHLQTAQLSSTFPNVSPGFLHLRHVALSGDGEPTLCPNFEEVLETVVHLRASGKIPHFKIVLITNASGLTRPAVLQGIRLLTRRDEVWAKLDGGTQAYLERINGRDVCLAHVLENIGVVARERPVVIQTMVPAIDGRNPFLKEIAEYAARLRELTQRGAQIQLVQIYSANRPTCHSECGHLSLRALSEIAKEVRARTGLRTEVF